jgi:hypothetical protein
LKIEDSLKKCARSSADVFNGGTDDLQAMVEEEFVYPGNPGSLVSGFGRPLAKSADGAGDNRIAGWHRS